MTRLHALPKLVLPVITLALLLVGLFAPAVVGVPALVIVAIFLGWLAYLSWPRASGGTRIMRILAVLLILGYAVYRVV